MSLKNLNLMIYHADLQPARGMISPGVFFTKKQKKASTESGESSADKKSSAGQMFLFYHHTRVRIPVRNTLHSALRLRLTFAAQIGNEPVTASYHIYSGTECEARSIMHALVTKALSLSYHF